MASPTRKKPTLLGELGKLNAPIQEAAAGGKVKKWTPEQIGALVAKTCEGTSTDPLVVLAVFDVESGFNNLAVGDGGHSFGLRQLNDKGQLGSHSKEWAFDPNNAVPDAVSALAGVRDGKGAAAVQRPLDRSGYAKKVDARLKQLRKAFAPQPGAGNPNSGGKKWSPERAAVREVAKTYGLRHTSGDRAKKTTATGGVSDHWQGQTSSWADDYSNGYNTPQMKAFQRAMLARGMKQVIGPLDGPSKDHMDHVHVAGYSTTGQGEGSGSGGSAAGAGVAAVKAALSGNLQKAALGVLGAKTGGAVDVAAGAAGAASDAIQSVVLDSLKVAFRYGLILAIVLAGAALMIVGLGRAAGEAS